MTFAKKFNVTVACQDSDGNPTFIDAPKPAHTSYGQAMDLTWVWAVEGGLSLHDNIGGAPKSMSTAGPNGSTFGIAVFPAHSAGKLNVTDVLPESPSGHEGNPGMHQTDTIDYEVVLSGKIDIVLPGNQRRTLGPGDLNVMVGVAHAWENHYDEECVFVAVTVGVHRK
jgi:hypothetical protein